MRNEWRIWRTDRPIALICQKGQRAHIAATLLQSCGMNLLVIKGGTNAWKNAGSPLVRASARWSLERQVRFAAGLLVLTGSLLAALVSPYGLIVPGFIGCGLTFAGATDICPMGMLLARFRGTVRAAAIFPLRALHRNETCKF